MIDIKFLRENPEAVKENIKKRKPKLLAVKAIERIFNMERMSIDKMNFLDIDIRILKQENYMLRGR